MTHRVVMSSCRHDVAIDNPAKYSKDGTIIWTLKPSRYRIYGLITSQMSNPTQFVIPCQSSTCTIISPPTIRVKIWLGVQAIIIPYLTISRLFVDIWTVHSPEEAQGNEKAFVNACPTTIVWIQRSPGTLLC